MTPSSTPVPPQHLLSPFFVLPSIHFFAVSAFDPPPPDSSSTCYFLFHLPSNLLPLCHPPTTHTPPLFFQIIASLDEDPAAQSKQLTLRLQQIAAALENKVTDL